MLSNNKQDNPLHAEFQHFYLYGGWRLELPWNDAYKISMLVTDDAQKKRLVTTSGCW